MDRIGDFIRIDWVQDPSEAASKRSLLEGAGFTVITPGFSDGPVLRGQLRHPGPIPLMVHEDVAENARHLLRGVEQGDVTPLAAPDDTPEIDFRKTDGGSFLDWLRNLGRPRQ